MTWDPAQYDRFKAQRREPFVDLVALVEREPGCTVIDVGCGTGEHTVLLHVAALARATLGIDSSPAMLARAPAFDGVSFQLGDLRKIEGAYDLVFSNAALHWVPDHADILRTWTHALRPRGQLAVQVPANADHPSHTIIEDTARALGVGVPPDPVASVQPPQRYAELLHELGFDRQHVRLQVYGHVLDSAAQVVEWVKGTNLTRVRAALDDAAYEAFVAEYARRLLERLGSGGPYYYTFKRILFWGRLPG